MEKIRINCELNTYTSTQIIIILIIIILADYPVQAGHKEKRKEKGQIDYYMNQVNKMKGP